MDDVNFAVARYTKVASTNSAALYIGRLVYIDYDERDGDDENQHRLALVLSSTVPIAERTTRRVVALQMKLWYRVFWVTGATINMVDFADCKIEFYE